MPKPPKFEGGGLSEGEGRFRTTEEKDVAATLGALEELNEERVTEEEAREIFGERFFGSKEVQEIFHPKPYNHPPIPFSHKELLRAERNGATLLLQCDNYCTNPEGKSPRYKPLTLQSIQHVQFVKTGAHLWDIPQHLQNGSQTPRSGWKLVFNSLSGADKGAVEQLEILFVELNRLLCAPGEQLPQKYQEAQAELKSKKSEIQSLFSSLSTLAVDEMLLKLKASELLLEPAVEIAYQLLLARKTPGQFRTTYGTIRTNTKAGGGALVLCSVNDGHFTCNWDSLDSRAPKLGVRVTRMG